jgi:hypothetical protein
MVMKHEDSLMQILKKQTHHITVTRVSRSELWRTSSKFSRNACKQDNLPPPKNQISAEKNYVITPPK